MEKYKNIYLKAYIEKNLGDDLFVKIITDRYSNTQFYINSDANYLKINNLISYKQNKFINLTNKIIKKISKGRISIDKYYINKNDLYVLIGGSLFIERKRSKKYLEKVNKKYYILGSNFGPYYSKEFYKKYYNYFSLAEDVCFRDEKTYNLFRDLKNTRKASDIVFSLNTQKYVNNKNSNIAIISVVDCSRKMSVEYKEFYENKIVELIKFLKSKSYLVKLMSFCKSEGDEDAIYSILQKLNDFENISTYFYDGDINQSLEILNDSKLIIGTRFHANILGLILNKTVIPIAYSDKTIDVLHDMNFKGKFFDIRDMDNFNIFSIKDEDLNYKLDVSFQRKDAKRQFEMLDKILKENE